MKNSIFINFKRKYWYLKFLKLKEAELTAHVVSSFFTVFIKVKGDKKIKKDISEADSIIKIKNIFESNQIWN